MIQDKTKFSIDDEKSNRDCCAEMSVFDSLYGQFYPAVYRFVYRLLGNEAETEETTQETFVRLYLKLASKENLINPRAWIYRVAANLCRDLLRKKRRATEHSNSDPFEVNQQNAESEFIKREEIRRMRRALRRLPFREQTILMLYNDGLSYAEMADILNIRLTSVGKTLSRAIDKLAGKMEQGGAYEMPE